MNDGFRVGDRSNETMAISSRAGLVCESFYTRPDLKKQGRTRAQVTQDLSKPGVICYHGRPL